MKFIAILLATSTWFANANDKIKMAFKNEEITNVIEAYSKATGQKFIVDPSVRGKVTFISQEPVTKEEAFDQMSSALSLNGFAISKKDQVMIVGPARNIQKTLIEVSTNRPAVKPERMVTWIYNLKALTPDDAAKELRFLVSKDGEMMVKTSSKQIVFTDWTSNLNRIADLMKEIDIKR